MHLAAVAFRIVVSVAFRIVVLTACFAVSTANRLRLTNPRAVLTAKMVPYDILLLPLL